MEKRGFTLIELLVVIAIIGILSAVVLASLGVARTKGYDAAIQSDLSTVQVQAELYYSTNSTYGSESLGRCTQSMFNSDTNIQRAIAAAFSAAGGSGAVACNASGASACCGSNGGAYAVTIKLASTGYWCVDSAGNSKVWAGTPAHMGAGVYVCQ